MKEAITPSAHAKNLKLLPNEAAVSVMTATERQGAGASSVVFGDQADLNAQFAAEGNNVVTNDAIQLYVPGSTAKDATTYRATLTWELTTAPGEVDGENESKNA